jgi:acetylornithine deacetylase/succinyl-diaminopimelate desuccinylase-like protein
MTDNAVTTVAERIAQDADRITDELSRLVAIPSVGYPGYDPAHVRASAQLTADILRDAGVPDVRILEPGGGHPAVYGEVPGPPGAPTVLLYAHHDVQPAADPDDWRSPPFEPQIRDGRLYGRGAADDKSGIVIHAAALRALGLPGGATLPVTVRIVVEGEEECSVEHLSDLVEGHADLLRADVALVADGGNDATGVPTIGTSIRGTTSVEVRVDVLPIAQHSGGFGGPLPDAAMALARMIAALHDDDGNVAVRGLHSFTWEGTPVTEEEFREDSGVFPEVRLIGSGSIADRTLSKPAINVLAFEAPRVIDAANQIVPTARAVIGLRLAPGDDPVRASGLLRDHMLASVPWGVRAEISEGDPGHGYLVDTTTPAYLTAERALGEAFGGVEVHGSGSGGSIPIVPMLAETFPGIQVLIVGAGDNLSNYHSTDESVDLADLRRMAVAEALFLSRMGAG